MSTSSSSTTRTLMPCFFRTRPGSDGDPECPRDVAERNPPELLLADDEQHRVASDQCLAGDEHPFCRPLDSSSVCTGIGTAPIYGVSTNFGSCGLVALADEATNTEA